MICDSFPAEIELDTKRDASRTPCKFWVLLIRIQCLQKRLYVLLFLFLQAQVVLQIELNQGCDHGAEVLALVLIKAQ